MPAFVSKLLQLVAGHAIDMLVGVVSAVLWCFDESNFQLISLGRATCKRSMGWPIY